LPSRFLRTHTCGTLPFVFWWIDFLNVKSKRQRAAPPHGQKTAPAKRAPSYIT
jgi:hypothetical protein